LETNKKFRLWVEDGMTNFEQSFGEKRIVIFWGRYASYHLMILPSIWDPWNGTPTGDPKEPIEELLVGKE
jgi:hypothetical protein